MVQAQILYVPLLTLALLLGGCFGKEIPVEVVFTGDNCRGLPIGVREIELEALKRLAKQHTYAIDLATPHRYFAIARGYKATPQHDLSLAHTKINGNTLELWVEFVDPEQGVMLPLDPTYPCLVVAIENQLLSNSTVKQVIVFDKLRREISNYSMSDLQTIQPILPRKVTPIPE